MTEVLTRPATRSRAKSPRAGSATSPRAATSSLWWRGVLAALWAVSVGLAVVVVLVLVAWAADSRASSSAATAVHTALQIWLAGEHVPLAVRGGSVNAAPLLLTGGLAFLLARAAAVLARGHGVEDLAGGLRVALAVGLPYGALSTFVAAAATSGQVRPMPVAALAVGLVGGTAAAGWGAVRGTGQGTALLARLPGELATALRGGAAATAVLLAGAFVVLAVALGLHLPAISGSTRLLGGGAVGLAGVVVVDLALLPNAVVCALAYLCGPGFALGGSVGLGGVTATAGRPLLPLAAAAPAGPAGGLPLIAAGLLLVVAGVVSAWRVARAGRPLGESMATAVGAGIAAGLLTLLCAAVAGGTIAPAGWTFGPSPWALGLTVAAEVAIVGSGAVGVLTWRRGR